MHKDSHGRHGAVRRALGLALLMGSLVATVAVAGPSGETSVTEPDFASDVPGTGLISEGNVQLEANVARASDGKGTEMTRAWTTPTLLRLGMPNYEFRVQSSGYSRTRTYNSTNHGLSAFSVGVKGVLPQTYDRDLSLAVVLQAGLPSGSTHFEHKGVRPEFQLIGAWQLPNANSVGGVAGISAEVDNVTGDRFPNAILGVNFAHSWNPRVSTYTEIAGREIRSASRGGKNLQYSLGGAWRAMPGTQLNASAAWGLKDNDTDFTWKLGVSRRFRPPSPGSMSKKEDTQPQETPSATTEDGK